MIVAMATLERHPQAKLAEEIAAIIVDLGVHDYIILDPSGDRMTMLHFMSIRLQRLRASMPPSSDMRKLDLRNRSRRSCSMSIFAIIDIGSSDHIDHRG